MSEAQQTAAKTPEERWGVMQVAAYLKCSYQTARNNMLTGDFGLPDYNAQTRKLTVLASAVRATTQKASKKKRTK